MRHRVSGVRVYVFESLSVSFSLPLRLILSLQLAVRL